MRVAIALELSGVGYNKNIIDIASQEHKSEAFIKINKAGNLPCIRVDGKTIAQSGAIIEFLLKDKRPELWPEEEIEIARCKAAVFNAVSDIGMQSTLAMYLGREGHDEAAEFVENRMWSQIYAMTEKLKNHKYILGDKITIADYANFPVIYMREKQIRKIKNLEYIYEWIEEMKNDEAVVTAIEFAGRQI